MKAYSHLSSFREELPFEVWFTRILINGCLDRIKARTRRERWLVPMPESAPGQRDFTERVAGGGPSPEDQVLGTRAPAEAGGGAGAAARAAALGVHVEPLRRLHVARSQRADRAERIDGSRAPVPGDPAAAHAARRGSRRASEAGRRNAVSILNRLSASSASSRRRRVRGDLERDGHRAGSRPSHPHLADCAQCRARYAAFAGWLDGRPRRRHAPRRTRSSRRAARDAAGADPPPARSARASGARHRVPAILAARRPSIRSGPQRWIAAAAAAGLIVGLGAGQFARHPRASLSGAAASAPVTPTVTAAAVTPSARGRAPAGQPRRVGRAILLRRSDAARTSPRVAALQRARRPDAARRATSIGQVGRGRIPTADLPQGPRHEGGRRRRAGRGLPQRASSTRSAPTTSSYDAGRLTVHLAREFGFCYGVDRAVDYAYQARRRFPGPQRLPDRRDHPQPARQRSAARRRHPLPERPGRALGRARPATTS